jgi:hypothetical protein
MCPTIASDQSPMVPKISPADIVVSFHRIALVRKKRWPQCQIQSSCSQRSSCWCRWVISCWRRPLFLLVKLDIPPVTLLLRGMFNAYFLVLAVAGFIGTVAFAVEGRLVVAARIGLIAAFAVSARHCFGDRWMPSLVPGMPAMLVRCGGYGGCIGPACYAMRSSLSLSWAAFLISL